MLFNCTLFLNKFKSGGIIMKHIKFKSLAIADLIATTSVSLVGCGGAKKTSGTYTASFLLMEQL